MRLTPFERGLEEKCVPHLAKGHPGDSRSHSFRKIHTGWHLPDPGAARSHSPRAVFHSAPPGGARIKHVRTPEGAKDLRSPCPKVPLEATPVAEREGATASSPGLLKVKMEAKSPGEQHWNVK